MTQKLEETGCFSIVSKIPASTAAGELVAFNLIGIGAGADCDGQVLVLHDSGITQEFSPRFLRRYADLEDIIDSAMGLSAMFDPVHSPREESY